MTNTVRQNVAMSEGRLFQLDTESGFACASSELSIWLRLGSTFHTQANKNTEEYNTKTQKKSFTQPQQEVLSYFTKHRDQAFFKFSYSKNSGIPMDLDAFFFFDFTTRNKSTIQFPAAFSIPAIDSKKKMQPDLLVCRHILNHTHLLKTLSNLRVNNPLPLGYVCIYLCWWHLRQRFK
jgi:hypothetical protein